jgi:hypothetical protein
VFSFQAAIKGGGAPPRGGGFGLGAAAIASSGLGCHFETWSLSIRLSRCAARVLRPRRRSAPQGGVSLGANRRLRLCASQLAIMAPVRPARNSSRPRNLGRGRSRRVPRRKQDPNDDKVTGADIIAFIVKAPSGSAKSKVKKIGVKKPQLTLPRELEPVVADRASDIFSTPRLSNHPGRLFL